MTLEEQLKCDASVLTVAGYVLHTTVHGREVNYQLTLPSGTQENLKGLLTRHFEDLRPQVWVPASLQARFGRQAVVDATLVAWTFANGVCA
jgi:hypothetical protein